MRKLKVPGNLCTIRVAKVSKEIENRSAKIEIILFQC
jgi:hypothetical protein